ncbi:MAG: zinc-binding dehydrogenase [Candidatus Bathyarchaeia archaeon]
MAEIMKAALLFGKRDVRVIDVPKPVVGPNEVLVKIKICLTSGTTVKQYERGYPGMGYPHGFGYEWAGEIVRVGDNVDKSLIGKKCISAVPEHACNNCFFCIRGQSNLCVKKWHAEDKVLKTDRPEKGEVSGYFKEYAKLKTAELYLLPDHVPLEDACQIPYIAYAIHGNRKLKINMGDVVAVIGCGAMGIIQMMLSRLRGARTVAIDYNPSRLDIAKSLGAADYVVTASDAAEAKRKINALGVNEGFGPDIVIEAVGHPQVYEEAVELVRRGGQVLFFGGAPEGTRVTFDTYRLHYDEITLVGSVGLTVDDVVRARMLVETGFIKPRIFISDYYPLTEIQKALELHLKGQGLKYAIIP